MLVRGEELADCAAVRFVHEQAFGRRDEADLVDRLRERGDVLVSLVAEVQGRIVGHILFSRVSIETAGKSVPAVALAPLAVTPRLQRMGIGGKLIGHGLDLLRREGQEIVLVFGSRTYYPRFGFSTWKARFLDSPFDPKHFMALELKPNALEDLRGKVKYPEAFGF